jgi:hypothetical protein
MAKSALLESGEIRPVFYQAGTFPADQRPRFVRAPFVILSIGGNDYVMPVSGASDARDLSNILLSSDFGPEQYLGRQDFGYESDEELVVGEHELGTASNDSWKSVHRFGYI